MTSVSFNQIPSNNRVPLFYAEVDNSRASYYTQNLKSLIVGQSVTTITEEPVLITSVAQAKTLYGSGSMIARMVDIYKENDSFGELWVMPLNDVAGTKAVGSVGFSGTATKTGTVFLYIAGELVMVPVVLGDTSTTVATKAVSKVNTLIDLPVIASSSTGTLTLTAKNSGTLGNGIDISLNYFPQFETLPTGITASITEMVSGATDPMLSTAITAIGDGDFEYWIHPFTDTTNLNFLRDELKSRWSPLEQKYGHGVTAINATVAALDTLGDARNDEHMTIVGYYDSPTWSVEVASAFGGVVAKQLNIDPARPLQTLELKGVVVPKNSSQMTTTEKNTLLFSGITPLYYTGGVTRIVRAITTYQTDVFGSPDPSYLDVNTLSTLAVVIRTLKNVIQTKFPRHKLADNGTNFGAGQAIVTPKILRGEIIAMYDKLENLGLVENSDKFAEELIVSRNPTDPNRVDVLFVPDLVNGLRIFAAKAEFVLNFNK